MERLEQLLQCGQSYWLDNLTRDMLDDGELARRVETEGLRGMTSNPKTFSEAISSGGAYDDQFRELAARAMPVEAIYEELAVADVRRACDVFRSVYDSSNGGDGFVSLEVSPHLAYDTEGTLEEARRLRAAVDRPNVFIKIPGTVPGLDAIEQALYEGINVNITLLFSVERYEAVAERYLRALEHRIEEGQAIDGVRSVASFFLSRIDVLTDQLLGQRIGKNIAPERPVSSHAAPEAFFGKLAVASAKIAYKRFKRITSDDRWQKLQSQGARAQRLLWASTSTKNPLYSDVKYVNPLIGPETINTMPSRTIEAFADHGTVRPKTIEENVGRAEKVFEALDSFGLDIGLITQQLEDEGVRKFIDPFDDLMGTLADKRRDLIGTASQHIAAGEVESKLADTFDALDEMKLGRRFFAKDPSLWTEEPSEADDIASRLGWLDSPAAFHDEAENIQQFAAEVGKSFDRVLLLGMGGSSLAADVCRQIFGAASGWLELRVLDSTDPEAVSEAEKWASSGRTLFLVASKSGTTTETLCFYRYFYERLQAERDTNPGDSFVAITDPGSPLVDEAGSKGFRRVFENPPDIGGRYSALSYFGLVPMALMGIDVGAMVSTARDQAIASGPAVPVEANPALALGALLGTAAREGRDKVTFVSGGSADAFGYWAEQLLAESTGKDGRGLVPIVDEPIGEVENYRHDRVFVSLSTTESEPTHSDELRALEDAGHPVVRIAIEDPLDLGGEFLRFELATAVAGMVLDVNPFDEPNVAESKENTRRLLDEWKSRERFEQEDVLARGKRLAVRGDPTAHWLEGMERMEGFDAGEPSLPDFFEKFFSLAKAGDYLALLTYLSPGPKRSEKLQRLRVAVRDRLQIATTLGYGPRYLHSTGQLHKGGPGRGLFIFITARSETGDAIPGEKYGFGTLEHAQALGDLGALRQRGYRAIHVELGDETDAALDELVAAIVDKSHLTRER